MLALGVAPTMTANVGFGVGFSPVGAVVSALPAVALIGAAEMAPRMIRRARSGTAPVTALSSAPALSGKRPGARQERA
jgi:hypothetical protein